MGAVGDNVATGSGDYGPCPARFSCQSFDSLPVRPRRRAPRASAEVPTVATVAMEKLLSTVIQLKASDLHISVGQPPVVRHHGRMRKLDAKVLDSDDTTALMKSITPDRCQQELQECGGTDFAIEYTGGVRFRVAVFRQRGTIGIVMRRIPTEFLSFEQLR